MLPGVDTAKLLHLTLTLLLKLLQITLNEAEGIEISGYPTLYWYAKDKNVAPVTFNGQRDKEGILAFIKDHTEYEWVEPAVAQTEEEL